MSDIPPPTAHVYVVKLAPGDGPFCGRLEHVASGRRHLFHDPQSLLACIAREEAAAGAAEACAAAPVAPREAGHDI